MYLVVALVLVHYQSFFIAPIRTFQMLYIGCRCTTKSEDDYRPLFENFVMDLLEMAHHPEWPAVEPVLVLLGNLLVGIFKDPTEV